MVGLAPRAFSWGAAVDCERLLWVGAPAVGARRVWGWVREPVKPVLPVRSCTGSARTVTSSSRPNDRLVLPAGAPALGVEKSMRPLPTNAPSRYRPAGPAGHTPGGWAMWATR